MHYFLKELWRDLNCPNAEKRKAAEREWSKNAARYSLDFDGVKPLLPSGFLSAYEKNSGFHDFTILSVSFLLPERTCRIRLSDGQTRGTLELCGVTRYRFDLQSFENCVCGKPAWGYAEFSAAPAGTLHLSVLCDMDNEMSFEFRSLSFMEDPAG
jgi:hypothetical protein